MALPILPELVGLGVATVVLGLLYCVYREFRVDYETGEYHFTWGVGVVALFTMGFAPGLVGVGLYLTAERGYPIHWLFASVLASLFVIGLFTYGVDTTTAVETVGAVAGGR